MIRRFLKDRRGNFAVLIGVAIVPIMGALALAVDYSELTRQRAATMSALDAAGIATARRVTEGATDTQLIAYANDFFEANLGTVEPAEHRAHRAAAEQQYRRRHAQAHGDAEVQADVPAGGSDADRQDRRRETDVDFRVTSEVRLKNTLEVALVLDNSGSMAYLGSGTGDKRITLLKAAAKQLVDTLAAQASQMKQVAKPVQFGIVPFSASVNVAPEQRRQVMDGHDRHLADPSRKLRLVEDDVREQPPEICPEGRRRLVQAWRGMGTCAKTSR